MGFPDSVAARLLADCKRYCCVCWKSCGGRIQLHHIVPGGSDDEENALPVYLDCHAEIESKSNMVRRFTEEELRNHKRGWLEICRERPDVLISSVRRNSEMGPIESLLSELEYNGILLRGEDQARDIVPLAINQFDRAIAANALVILDPGIREELFLLYKLFAGISELIRLYAHDDPRSDAGARYITAITPLRGRARSAVVSAALNLKNALSITGE
jgi:hypothetical protein